MSRKEFLILPVPFLLQPFLRNESQRRGVHAVAQARGFGTVGEDMPEMGIGALAADFGARQARRFPSRACLLRRSQTHGPALLHELRGAAIHSEGTVARGRVRGV